MCIPGVFSIIKSSPIRLFFYVSIPTNMDLPFLGSISDLEIVNSSLPLCNHPKNIPQSYLLCSPAAGWHYLLGQHVALTCLFVSNLMVTVWLPGICGLIQWKIVALQHHWVTRLTLVARCCIHCCQNPRRAHQIIRKEMNSLSSQPTEPLWFNNHEAWTVSSMHAYLTNSCSM